MDSTSPPIHELSSCKLRENVVAACHLDQRWRRPQQTPNKLETVPWHSLTVDAKLLAGGKWVLSLRTDGELQL